MNEKRQERTKQNHTQLNTVRKASNCNQILWENKENSIPQRERERNSVKVKWVCWIQQQFAVTKRAIFYPNDNNLNILESN